jgi:hypothetical protein
MAEELKKSASHHIILRLTRYSYDEELIRGHIQTITWSIQDFMVTKPTFQSS